MFSDFFNKLSSNKDHVYVLPVTQRILSASVFPSLFLPLPFLPQIYKSISRQLSQHPLLFSQVSWIPFGYSWLKYPLMCPILSFYYYRGIRVWELSSNRVFYPLLLHNAILQSIPILLTIFVWSIPQIVLQYLMILISLSAYSEFTMGIIYY